MIKCAFYEKEITPPLGFNLPGYFNFRPGVDVKDRLYSKAAVIDNGKETVAFITIDACFSPAYMRDDVVQRIEKFTNIKAENIVFAANHTHTGMPFEDEFAIDGIKEYYTVVCSLIADCVILAFNRLADCKITYGKGVVEGISFNRNYFMKNSTPRTNPGRLNPNIEGPVAGVDTELPVLFFKDSKGTPKGAIISYACHQDCVDGQEMSGDYASILAKELKKVYGSDFVTVFMIGACGNINHFNVNKKEDAPDHYVIMGKIVAGEAIKVIAKSEDLIGDEISAKLEFLKINRLAVAPEVIENAKHIVATIKPVEGVKIAADDTDPDQYNLAMAKMLVNFINGPEVYDVPVQAIRIGDFLFYAFSSEIYYQFGEMVKEDSPTAKNMVATMCNASLGYVPTRDMYYDTIYESLPGSNKLDKEAGYIMANELAKMGKELIK